MTEFVDFAKVNGLVPVIVQDAGSKEILMLAYMNCEALEETLRTRRLCYYSRSRKELWRKGETSGNSQELVAMHLDCDADTLLVQVHQTGDACHEGYRSCFFRKVTDNGLKVIEDRIFDTKEVYGG